MSACLRIMSQAYTFGNFQRGAGHARMVRERRRTSDTFSKVIAERARTLYAEGVFRLKPWVGYVPTLGRGAQHPSTQTALRLWPNNDASLGALGNAQQRPRDRRSKNRPMVDRVEALEREVEQLDRSDFERFSLWFAEYEASIWDHKIEQDFAAGKLDFLIDEARLEGEAATFANL